MKSFKGRCLCGSVTFCATTKPIVTRACWCQLCQTLASGNATINLAFPKNCIEISGKLHDYFSVADDGNKMHRKFCPNCGTHMFSEAEERPNMIVVRAGTLDDSEQINIEGIIWTSEAPSWAYLDPNIKHFAKQPPTPKPSTFMGFVTAYNKSFISFKYCLVDHLLAN